MQKSRLKVSRVGWPGSRQERTVAPVSYTHLDVYKRQPSSSLKSVGHLLNPAQLRAAFNVVTYRVAANIQLFRLTCLRR